MTRAGAQLQLWMTWTRRPSGAVAVVAVTAGGRSRHLLAGSGASQAASPWARSGPGTVPTHVMRHAPWRRVVTAGQRPEWGWS
ncbi:MAG TPA: hypothetical protein VJT31_29605 [Rugosimonospora sp.]|nr:hypothetical protein [Rugosimonospora sp.]